VYDTCIVVDCSQWLDVMASYTKAKFPDVNICVAHSNSSLSGFCVILKMPPPPPSSQGRGALESSYCMVSRSEDGAATTPSALGRPSNKRLGGIHLLLGRLLCPVLAFMFSPSSQGAASKGGLAAMAIIVRGACWVVRAILLHANQKNTPSGAASTHNTQEL
jgi:hypothetical protein